MLKTKEGFELVPLCHEDKDSITKLELVDFVKKKGLDVFGVEEMMDCDDATLDALYEKCGRYWLVTKHGLVVRGNGFGRSRDVVDCDGPSSCFGVVGVRRKTTHP